MAYNGLTDIGAIYLAECLAYQKPVIFTKIKVGDGSIPIGKTGQTTTELYSFKKEAEISSKEQYNSDVKLTILLNNLNLEQGFYVKELGIYVDDNGTEKLYWYINKDTPSFLFDKNTPSTHRYNVYCEVSSNESTVINFTGEGLLIDKKFVKDSIKNSNDYLINDFINKKQNINDNSLKTVSKNISDAINEVYEETKRDRGERLPIGTVIPFISDNIPLGYLLCDGREITQDKYPELYQILPFGRHIDERVFRNLIKNEIPVMKSNSQDNFVVTTSSDLDTAHQGWKAFDNMKTENNCWIAENSIKNGWLKIMYPYERAVSKFALTSRSSANGSKIKSVSFYGITSQGAEEQLVTEIFDAPMQPNQTKYFEIPFTIKEYKGFKIDITNSEDDIYSSIGELKILTVNMKEFPNNNQDSKKKYLPNLKNQFLRGKGDGRELLTWQNDDNKKHNHKIPLNYPGWEERVVKEYFDTASPLNINFTMDLDSATTDNTYGRPRANETYTGTESRPQNISVNYIIKAKNEPLGDVGNLAAGNAEMLDGKTRLEFEKDIETVSDIQTVGIQTLSKKIKHLNKLDETHVSINKHNGFIKLNIDGTFIKEKGTGFSVDIGTRSNLTNKTIYLYRNEVEPLAICQLSTNSTGWGSPLYNVTPRPVQYKKNLYYIDCNEVLEKIPQDAKNIYLILYDSSNFNKIGENYYNIFIETENKINYDSELYQSIAQLSNKINTCVNELIEVNLTKQKGFLTKEGTYSGADKGYYSQSISYPCKKRDIFLYKGIGESLAYSYLMKDGANIINSGQLKSIDKYTEIEIPRGVNNIIFSSYSKKENEIIFDVKRKNPTVNDKIVHLEKLVYDNTFKETKQKGYLTSDGQYQGTASFSRTIIFLCTEGDIFLYKGIGQASAYSYLMKYGDAIIKRGQIKSPKDYVEVSIPKGVDNIVFSSYATLEEDIVLDVKRKNPKDLENRVINLESQAQSFGNVLTGKKWVACGDSFTAGGFTGFVDDNGLSEKDSPVIFDKEWNMYKTYPWWIARRNGMILKNEAIAGSIMALSKQYVDGTQDIKYKQPFSHERYKRIPADTDYITIWFGINDASFTNLGTISDADNTTFYGAWNVVLEWLITNRPYAKIGIVVTELANESYRKATREIAEKWGIPYLDMMGDKKVPVIFGRENNLGLDDKAYQLRLNSFIVSETNFHPNIKAHEYQSTFIENFLRSL